ncbi:MAG: DUF1156 domain-containing protein [Bacteroidia bacterium]|nr:DUF1156 domain-containing protein [Bacteroidia bacterium]
MKNKRFIEETFPIKEVSIEGAREKNIRHGHISTLHIWWARRPLATSRATNFAALIPVPEKEEEKQKIRNFIAELSKWENSNNEAMLEKARKMILDANGGIPPKVFDPFGGGGSIPLEALRLGCDTYSNDYNPVAVFIQKCTLEYPQKYGKPISKSKYFKERLSFNEITKIKEKKEDLFVNEHPTGYEKEEMVNPLLEDVKYWSNWVLEQAKNEIQRFYPDEKDGSKAEIPLMRQYWLAKKERKKISLYIYVENGKVQFSIVGTNYDKIPLDFDPEHGTISRAVVTCPVCGFVIDDKTTRKLFQIGKSGQKMVAVVFHKPGQIGKKYRISDKNDINIYEDAEKYLKEKRGKLILDCGIDPVPDEALPPKETLGFRVQRYGMLQWGDLFDSRQKLSLITFVEKVRQVYEKILTDGVNKEYAKAVVSYLALGIDMAAAFSNTLARWENTSEAIKQLFGRQALPMLWDYAEANPFSSSSGSFETGWEYYFKVIKHCSATYNIPVNVSQSSATLLQNPDNNFDAVITDPPYYDNVPYSYLSDFFYVWLKRSIGDLFPELFSTPLTPKSNEIVAYSNIEGGFEAGKKYFEDKLRNSFREFYRILKENGIAIIVYAHKSTSGWETLINSLLDSGLIITSAWPIKTEMEARLRAKDSAALSSSIYIVARKMKRQPTGFYNEVKEELKQYLSEKLDNLWAEGITGADFFIAAIGSGIEVFGKYEKVMDYEGNVKRADVLLDDVREIVMQYTVKQILHNGFSGEISELAKFYVIWRFSFGEAKAEFDEANKLARSVGIDLSQEWSRQGFIKKEKEFIRVLGPQNRKIEEVEDSFELIDVLHRALLLYEMGRKDEMMQLLAATGFGKSDVFYRVAQAVSESLGKLTPDSKEKKLLDGFLGGKERIRSEISATKVKKDSQLDLSF